jgi:hypothetical protein
MECLLRSLATGGAQEFGEDLLEALEAMVHAVKDDLLDFVADKHATFVARSLLAFLSGSFVPDQKNCSGQPGSSSTGPGCLEKLQRVQHLSGVSIVSSASHTTCTHKRQPVPSPEVAAVLSRHVATLASVFLGPIVRDDQLASLQRSTAASAFLQALLIALQNECALL